MPALPADPAAVTRARFRQLQQLSNGDATALTILRARRFLSDYPDFGPAWLLLGIALVELARHEEAEAALRRSLSLAPPRKRRIPLAHLGHLFEARGDYRRAAHWYRRGIAADRGHAGCRIRTSRGGGRPPPHRGATCAPPPPRRLTGAGRLRRLPAPTLCLGGRIPRQRPLAVYFGAVLARSGRLRDAEGVHRRATGCRAGCIDEAFLNLGLVLRAQERFEEAAGCLREALRRGPQYRAAREALRDVERCRRWQAKPSKQQRR